MVKMDSNYFNYKIINHEINLKVVFKVVKNKKMGKLNFPIECLTFPS